MEFPMRDEDNPRQGLSPAQAAYIAAMIDGEGSIQISRTPPSGVWKNTHYQLFVSVYNTNLRVHRYLERVWPGFKVILTDHGDEVSKDSYAWRGQSSNAYLLLLQVRPYLVIKGVHADTAIRFQEGVRKCPRGYPLTMRERYRRERLFTVMKRLNRKGPTPAATTEREGFQRTRKYVRKKRQSEL
jgi:hypothetical protein